MCLKKCKHNKKCEKICQMKFKKCIAIKNRSHSKKSKSHKKYMSKKISYKKNICRKNLKKCLLKCK